MEIVRVRTKQEFIYEMENDCFNSEVKIILDNSDFSFVRLKVKNLGMAKYLINCIAKLKRTPKSMWISLLKEQ